MESTKLSGDTGPEEWVRRLHGVLRRVFRRAGLGSVKRVEEALGLCSGSIRKWRLRGRLDLGMLCRVLDELGVPPARFFTEAFGTGFDPVDVARRPFGPPKDPVVKRALARWEAPESEGSVELTPEELRTLDGLRSEDPKLAVRKVDAALKCAAREQLPRLLAFYGSARRAQARLDKAQEALHHALQLAERAADLRLCADILQRLGVAYAYAGNHPLGLLFARQAAYEFEMLDDVRGQGRSLVDQGSRFSSLDRLDGAVKAYRAALRYLPEDEVCNRFVAYQSLAVIRHRQGDLREAAEHVRCAEELAPKVGKELAVLLYATKARIAMTQGDYARAEQSFVAVIDIYKTLSPINAALASVDLVRSQILGGQVGSAFDTIKGMAALLKPLENNKLACEAVRQLIRDALTGERITRRMLDQVTRQIRKGRARLGGRARGQT